jgi:hypothetical protein
VTTTVPSLTHVSIDDDNYDEEDENYDEEEAEDDDYYNNQDNKLPHNLEQKSNGKTTVTESSIGEAVTIKTDGNTKIFTQTSPTQRQTVVVNTDRPFKLTQTQNGKTFVYPPPKIDKEDQENDPKNVPDSLIRNKQKDKQPPQISYSTRYLPSKSEKTSDKSDNVVTITNSGSVDDGKNEKSKFASTYYTKNCGNVTFSCNVIYGKNGRSKVCRPKQTSGKC